MNTRPPSVGELRLGERANWGARPQPTAKIRRWQTLRNSAGTMLGFLSIELPSRLIINEARLMIGQNGKHWIARPAVKQVDQDGNRRLDVNGKQLWSPIVEFASRDASEKFRDLVLDALHRQHPEALSS
jgi:hypothetical protein